VLIAPAVSGAPEAEIDQETRRFETLIDAARGDLRETNRLEAWLWLDGPSAPQGRVGGQARALALDMNAIILGNGTPEHAGTAGLRAWDRLEEIQVPATVACGQLDIPFIRARSQVLASRLPRGSYQELPGVAHQPYLEQPWQVTELIRSAMARPGPHPG
jgi:pimeloyl-ACP methyl ester carboxylesterase